MQYHSSQLPLDKNTKNFSYEEMFLYVGWFFGLEIGEEIHRYELFGYIQTHIDNKSEESLQGTIESSRYWNNIKGKGLYLLNASGKSEIKKEFGVNPKPHKRIKKYQLWREYKNRKFLIDIDARKKRLTCYIDGEPMSGNDAIDILDSLGVDYKTKSGSFTSRFWNWIIQDNDYYWEAKQKDNFDIAPIIEKDSKMPEPIIWILYVEKDATHNFEISREKGIWGASYESRLRTTQSEEVRGRVDIMPGDFVVFLHDLVQRQPYHGSYPRVNLKTFIEYTQAASLVVLAQVMSPLYENDKTIWSNDVYPYRFKYKEISDKTNLKIIDLLTEKDIDNLRKSAINNGKLYPISKNLVGAFDINLEEYYLSDEEINELMDNINNEGDSVDVITETAIKEKQEQENYNNRNYWIFQANPSVYNLESALTEIEKPTFSVSRFKDEIKKGDIAYLWVSGKDAGLIAKAKILSNPSFRTQNPEEEKFSIDKEQFRGEQLRVEIMIEEIFARKITRDEILENNILQNMTIIRSPQGTNFQLTEEQADEIQNLIDEIGVANFERVNTRPVIKYTLQDLIDETGYEEEIIKEWLISLKRKGQIIFYGPPGTGKTFIARKFAKYITSTSGGDSEIIQFHPSYAYEDFVQGIRPITRDDGSLEYSIQDGSLINFCNKVRKHNRSSVLIIDEINRAELSRVFGELMYLLEYRDAEITLASGQSFSFPKNVYLIGTMNTADRSIALVDHALRRRFDFIRLFPDYELLLEYHQGTGFDVEGLIDVLKQANREIGDMNYSVGISFFMTKEIEKYIKSIWQMEIVPYLEEYFFDDQSKVDNYKWENVSDKIFKQ